ncbi:MAG: RluA family pseudouridine synthase [Oscillospiraceae bacterium]|nr:RluA family pseudouridine synthase [Oscillospiraceae bacterium]
MKEFTVGKNDAGQRLDRFVGKAAPLLPDSLLQKAIRRKDVKINGKPAKGDARLSQGDTVRVYVPDEFFQIPREDNAWRKIAVPRLDVIYEDDNILLADKKPGVLCHSAGEWTWNTLIANIQAYLRAKGEWDPAAENSFAPALCNRIDRNTGGIVIAAKNAETLRVMDEKIKLRELEKTYLCAVVGRPHPPEGRLEGYLFKDAKKNQVYVYDQPRPGARTAVTEYKTIASEGRLSLVQCRLVTGRTHQIRAQFRHAGCPLLGDGKYGSERDNRSYGEKGQALCSWKLKFCFATPAGHLEYLNGREFRAPVPEFVEKYFKTAKPD